MRIDVYCLDNLNKQHVFLKNEESDAIKISKHVQRCCIILRSWLERLFISTVDIFEASKRFLNANRPFDLVLAYWKIWIIFIRLAPIEYVALYLIWEDECTFMKWNVRIKIA